MNAQALLSQPGEPLLPDLPAAEVVAVPDTGSSLQLFPADMADELRNALKHHAESADGADVTDGVNAYPYRLATRRLPKTLNSAYQGAAFTRQRHPSEAASMSPDDLAREGLTDGDTVKIASAHGRLVTLVKADAALRPGTVSVPHMWGAQDAGARLPGEPFSGQLV